MKTPDEIPLLDYERLSLLQATLRNPRLLPELVELLSRESSRFLREFRGNAGDSAAIARQSHQLKSSSANLGAERLRYLYEHLEHRAGEPADTLETLQELDCELQATMLALSEFGI